MEIFEKQKRIATSGVDFSRKGSIDVKIVDLSLFINSEKDYFTTSSCSGRIILFDDKVCIAISHYHRVIGFRAIIDFQI